MANEFYTHAGYPAQSASGDSASARAEFDALQNAFNKLPALAGSALRLVRVSAAANALESVTPATAGVIAADGSVPMAANLPMGGNKITGLGAATVAGDAVRYEQGGTVAMVETHAAISKTTPVDADEVPIADSAASFALKKLTWANIKATLKTYFDTLYPVAPNIHAAPSKATPVDADEIGGTDSASSFSLIRITWANTKATLKTYFDALYASLAGATFTGLVNFKAAASISSAATVNLSTATGNTVHITGTIQTTAITMNSGQWMRCIADAAWPLTWHVTNLNLNTGGANYTCSAGDYIFLFCDGTTVFGEISRADGSINATSPSKLPAMAATQAAGAITVTSGASPMDFRSSTLTSGAITTVSGASADLVIPSGATLGVPTTQTGRIVVVEMNNAGTKEKAVIALGGGVDLSETGVISTTAISGTATANNVFYSTTARTNLAYKVIGIFDAVNTAGAWSSPTLVQGAAGEALTAMSGAGYGQTWHVAVTRTSGTTYYTGAKPETLVCQITNTSGAQGQTSISINGGTAFIVAAAYYATTSVYGVGSVLIPPFSSYVLTDSGTASVQRTILN